MKIMVFTEGTIFTHSIWSGIAREEIVRRVQDGERLNYAGAEIQYLTSQRSTDEVEQVREVLRRFGFPAGELLFRGVEEEYKDGAERAMPDVIIEDDCESIGGEIEMTYPHALSELVNDR